MSGANNDLQLVIIKMYALFIKANYDEYDATNSVQSYYKNIGRLFRPIMVE
jgi:hypothetical protein